MSGKAFRPCASASLTGPRARRCRLYFPLIGLEIIVFHRWMAKPQQSGEGDSLVSQALMRPYATATAAWLSAVDLQPSSVRKRKSRKQLTNTWGDPSLPGSFSGSPAQFNWLAVQWQGGKTSRSWLDWTYMIKHSLWHVDQVRLEGRSEFLKQDRNYNLVYG